MTSIVHNVTTAAVTAAATVTTPCYSGGDTSWVLIASVLVLGMIPALAFFEGGLLPRRSLNSLIAQIFSGVAILGAMWMIFGYSVTFGIDNWYVIGDFSNVFFIGVDDNCSIYSPTIPTSAFVAFQMMFASITPLLVTGAFAEKLLFKPYLIFLILWETFVYYPVAHWVWGKGWLSMLGVFDFAGGITIHTTAGVSSLIIALFLGRRKHFDKYHGEFPPHNIALSSIGAAMLWMGWFGFNAGSALQSGAVAAVTFLNTQTASCTSAIVWLVLSWIRGKKPSSVSLLNGAIAGLAGVTPAAGYINVQCAFSLGIILGILSYLSVYILKHKLRIDDSLDVSSVHGVTGIVGSLAVGFFSNSAINPAIPDGLIFFGPNWWRQPLVQLLGVVVCGLWASIVTVLIILFLKLLSIKVMLFQVPKNAEDAGIDQFEMLEHDAYDTEHNFNKDTEEEEQVGKHSNSINHNYQSVEKAGIDDE